MKHVLRGVPAFFLFASAAFAASLALAGCRKEAKEETPPAKGEMPVEQTPVSSIYEEKPGILYERPNRTPTSTTPAASPSPAPGLTPSPAGRGKR